MKAAFLSLIPFGPFNTVMVCMFFLFFSFKYTLLQRSPLPRVTAFTVVTAVLLPCESECRRN